MRKRAGIVLAVVVAVGFAYFVWKRRVSDAAAATVDVVGAASGGSRSGAGARVAVGTLPDGSVRFGTGNATVDKRTSRVSNVGSK